MLARGIPSVSAWLKHTTRVMLLLWAQVGGHRTWSAVLPECSPTSQRLTSLPRASIKRGRRSAVSSPNLGSGDINCLVIVSDRWPRQACWRPLRPCPSRWARPTLTPYNHPISHARPPARPCRTVYISHVKRPAHCLGCRPVYPDKPCAI
jgi:hypothetical protein